MSLKHLNQHTADDWRALAARFDGRLETGHFIDGDDPTPVAYLTVRARDGIRLKVSARS